MTTDHFLFPSHEARPHENTLYQNGSVISMLYLC